MVHQPSRCGLYCYQPACYHELLTHYYSSGLKIQRHFEVTGELQESGAHHSALHVAVHDLRDSAADSGSLYKHEHHQITTFKNLVVS